MQRNQHKAFCPILTYLSHYGHVAHCLSSQKAHICGPCQCGPCFAGGSKPRPLLGFSLQHSRTQLLRSLGKWKEKACRQVAIEGDSSWEEVFGLLQKKVYYLSFLQFLQTRVPLLEEEPDTMSTIHPLQLWHTLMKEQVCGLFPVLSYDAIPEC